MKIVFMGSPEFAVPSLEKLHASKHTISAVVTNIDKRRGRGGATSPTPVKEKALQLSLPVIEVQDLKSEDFSNALKNLKADLFVVVAFRVLPKHILDIPKIGSVNVHASLLPKYRGAAPIHWAVINGEEKTGCSIFFLDEKVDTGNIILQKETGIGREETTGQVYERLMHLGSEALIEAVDSIDSGTYTTLTQDDTLATPAPKIFKEHTHVQFSMTADEVHNKIRGLSPFPTAWATLNGEKINLYAAKTASQASINVGEIRINHQQLLVGCKDGAVELLEIQLPGKKRMNVADFLKGNTLSGKFE